MTDQEYIDSISGRSDSDYPAVVQVSDPLLVRVSKTSLLLNDTTFYAKIKKGLAFNGYVIYSSGIGTPIIEVDIGSTPETTSSGTVTTKQENDVDIAEIEQAASDFLDKLEARIATSEFQNPIKASIDRLCWQIHYDITKSKTNFVTAFEDQGFSKSITSVDGWSDSSTVVGRTLYDYFGWTGTITNNGSTLEYGNGLIGMTEKVAWNLKHDDETYSISKALREDNEVSVSNATHEQTVLEQQHYTNISVNQLGAFGDTRVGETSYSENNRTLFATLNDGASNKGYSGKNNKSLAMTVGTDVTGDNSAYKETIIAYDDEISNTKLGNFGGSIPGGSDHYRTLFETFNKDTVIGSATVYRGPSHIWDKTLCDTIGGTSNSTDSDEKKSIYTRMKKVVSDADAENDNVTYTVLGNTEIIDNKLGLFGEPIPSDSQNRNYKTLFATVGGASYAHPDYNNLDGVVGYRLESSSDQKTILTKVGSIYTEWDSVYINNGSTPYPCVRAYSSTHYWW